MKVELDSAAINPNRWPRLRHLDLLDLGEILDPDLKFGQIAASIRASIWAHVKWLKFRGSRGSASQESEPNCERVPLTQPLTHSSQCHSPLLSFFSLLAGPSRPRRALAGAWCPQRRTNSIADASHSLLWGRHFNGPAPARARSRPKPRWPFLPPGWVESIGSSGRAL